MRGALLPATIAPLIFLLGMSGQFGRLTGLDGFPTDSYLSWIVPLSCLQGAGFAGAATGANLARDIEQGWFDRLLVAPVPRPRAARRADPRRRHARAGARRPSCCVVGLAHRRRADRRRARPRRPLRRRASGSAPSPRCGAIFMARHVPHPAGRPADAAGRLPRRLPLDRLHARGAAARLARRASRTSTRSPRCSSCAPGDGRGHRAELGPHLARAASRWPGCSPCSARSRCSACAVMGR